MRAIFFKTALSFIAAFIIFTSEAQITNTYNSATTWTVPGGVSTITIQVYGAGGGTGGKDCGAGCTNAAAGPVGYVSANYTVAPGDVIGIYPGGKGVDGSNNVSNTGGGTGGVATYSASYNGGKGGNAGASGSSGGGGGGGAASVVTINSTIKIVSGGAGGGGGMANVSGSGQAGSSSISANGTSNSGGNGTQPGGDGGGGGGGGGGNYGSVGGGVYPTGGESAGYGGYRGNNSVIGASSIISNTTAASTSAGQVIISYSSTLPVSWLGFSATKQDNAVALNWITATEQNTKNYFVQHSTDGVNWIKIGEVIAAGNSNTTRHYSFTDRHPSEGKNYYRIQQNDIDNSINLSQIVIVDFSGANRGIKMYPNPVTNGNLHITLQESLKLKMYNSIGIEVMEKILNAGDHVLTISYLPKGIYFIRAKEEAISFVIQ